MTKEIPGEPPVITIDGPAASGKGTIAIKLGRWLGWHILSSGNIYRCLALKTRRQGLDSQDERNITSLSAATTINFTLKQDNIISFMDGECVDEEIAEPEIGKLASQIAVHPKVRTALLERQRSFAKPPGLVAEGRDMGTVVFPAAGTKIYLNASIEERGKRRQQQLHERGKEQVQLEEVIKALRHRDEQDSQRATSPLKCAKDAIVIDSTDLTVEQAVQSIINIISQRKEASGLHS